MVEQVKARGKKPVIEASTSAAPQLGLVDNLIVLPLPQATNRGDMIAPPNGITHGSVTESSSIFAVNLCLGEHDYKHSRSFVDLCLGERLQT